MSWLSAHIYFDGPLYEAAGDRVIIDDVAPLVARLRREKLITKYFFIRYQDDGNHIRLRTWAESGADDTLREVIESHLTSEESLRRVSRVAWIPYSREVSRYGGENAIAIAEQFFQASSDLATSILPAPGVAVDRGVRLAKGLLATLSLLHAFTRGSLDDTLAALRAHSEAIVRSRYGPTSAAERRLAALRKSAYMNVAGSREYIAETWRRLDAHEMVTSPLDRYRDELNRVRIALCDVANSDHARTDGAATPAATALLGLVRTSYAHMTCNRLGVSPIEEAYLSELGASGIMSMTSAVIA